MNIIEFAQSRLNKESALYRRPGAAALNTPTTRRTRKEVGGRPSVTPARLQSAKPKGVMARKPSAKPQLTPQQQAAIDRIPDDLDPNKTFRGFQRPALKPDDIPAVGSTIYDPKMGRAPAGVKLSAFKPIKPIMSRKTTQQPKPAVPQQKGQVDQNLLNTFDKQPMHVQRQLLQQAGLTPKTLEAWKNIPRGARPGESIGKISSCVLGITI